MAQRGIKANIDLVELEKLCSMQPTDAEVGAFFGVTERTILRRKKVKKFAEAMERGKARGKLTGRRLQMKMLEQGNPAMGIWLGKQLLGQTDHFYPEGTGSTVYIVTPSVSVSAAPTLAAPEPTIIDVTPNGRRSLAVGDGASGVGCREFGGKT